MKKLFILSIITFIASTCFAQSFNKERLDSLFQILEKKDKSMASIAISKNGELIYTNAIGYASIEDAEKATTSTKYRVGSISKMFTSALVLKAIEEKKINLNQTLDMYFPQIKNADKITIENLLNHRSGIANFTDDSTYMSYHTSFKPQKEMIEIIAKGGSDFEPNSKGSYSNSNYVLLSYILEKAYKKEFKEILNQKIIKPLGLKNTYFGGKTDLLKNESYSYKFNKEWVKEDETDMSIPMGAGAIVSTPADLTFFIEQLFVGKIISLASLDQMKTIRDNYGMGMFKFPYYDKKSFGHTGGIDGFQSVLSYFPEDKLAIALTSNAVNYANNNILLCVLNCYFNVPFVIPTFEEIAISPEIINSYLGQYGSTQIPLKIEITQKDTKLFVQATGQSAFPLEAITSTSFKFDPAGVVLNFNSEKKQMILKQGGKEFVFTKE